MIGIEKMPIEKIIYESWGLTWPDEPKTSEKALF